MGKMGSGKTLTMSILAGYLARQTGAPLHSNYALKYPREAGGLTGALKIESWGDIWEMENGIFCFDEMWLTMDARMWKDNVQHSQWINQTRKKKMIVFYTTQHIRQIEMRARNATDVLIYCEKSAAGHWLQFIDWQYRELGRRYLLERPSRFYDLYDTFEVLKALKPAKKKFEDSSSYRFKRRF